MVTRYIFAVLAGVFLILAAQELLRKGRLTPAGKTWSMVGVIFAGVALWLWISVVPGSH